MSRAKRITPCEETAEDVCAIFAEVRIHFGLEATPDLFLDLGRSKATLLGLWTFTKAAFAEGKEVSRPTKELIALAATAAADARHLSEMLYRSLEHRGFDEAMLNDLKTKKETMRLPERTRKILIFGRRATLDPAFLAKEDFDALHRIGLGDEDVAELIGFAGLLSGLIAMTRALGLNNP